MCLCVSACERKEKNIVFISGCILSLSLIWSLYFSFIPTLCPWELEFHPSGVARDKSCLSSHHWVRNSLSPLIFFCVFNYLILRVITGHHPFFWKMTVSMTLLRFVQPKFLPRPFPLIFWCLAMPVFCPFWFLHLAQPSICFLYGIISCFLLLIPKWTCEHGFFLLPLPLVWHAYVHCHFLWERCKEWQLLDSVCISVQKVYLYLSTALFHVFMREWHHSSRTKA